MKIAFVSNFLNHHQTQLCNQLNSLCDEFYFIATTDIPEEIQKLGYEDLNKTCSYVVPAFLSNDNYEFCKTLIQTLDVVIFGSCDNQLIHLRMQENKLSLIYSERILKRGLWTRFIPAVRKKIKTRFLTLEHLNLYVLCASAYLAYDLSLWGMKKPVYKWGYFPPKKEYEIKELMEEKEQNTTTILWVGRFVSLKHGKDALFAAKKLKEEGYFFRLAMIGTGKEEKKLRAYVKKHHLQEYVEFLGAMPPEKVRNYMEQAHIFLCTSNFMEGWGAVVNEAMNSGCAVVASHAVGAAPYLINHGYNGLLYPYRKPLELYDNVKLLIENKEYRKKLGTNGYDTISKLWNGEEAAKRLIEWIQAIEKKEEINYLEGPLSIAPILKNNWIRERKSFHKNVKGKIGI